MNHSDVLKLLFPLKDLGGVFNDDVGIEGSHLDDLKTSAEALLLELFPDTCTAATIAAWERIYGIIPVAGATLDERRLAVVQKKRLRRKLTRAYFVALAATVYPNTLRNGLVGYWRFEEPSWNGTAGEVIDLSGQGSHGQAAGGVTTVAAGKLGRGATFAGVDDAVNIGNPASLQLSEGTVAAWVKTDDVTQTIHALVCKWLAYGMFVENTKFKLYDFAASAWRDSGVVINDGQWHLVAFDFKSGEVDGTHLYVDGELKLTTTYTVQAQTEQLQLGTSSVPATQTLIGSLDEPVIWNRRLTAGEHMGLWYGGKGLRILDEELVVIEELPPESAEYGGAWSTIYIWRLHVFGGAKEIVYFEADESYAGDRLTGWAVEATLEGIITDLKPAHTHVYFVYDG